MKQLIIYIVMVVLFFSAIHACAQTNKWCDKDPNHPLCICAKQPTHPNCCCTPVELMFFVATICNSDNVCLMWETASEQDNDYFSVERSPDAYEWELIGNVKGSGTSNVPKSYEFKDKYPNNKKLYYRLSQYDLNGTYEYLGMQYVVFKWDVVEGFKVQGNVVRYQYFDATGGIAGNSSGLKILKVLTKKNTYAFKVWKKD